MLRKTAIVPGEVYHIYNRGVDKRDIFMDKQDRERFLALLYLCNSTEALRFVDLPQGETLWAGTLKEKITAVGAFCLMDNHFHLMVRETNPGGVTQFLRKLSTGYTMYFNKKYDRSGALFQGAFKSRHVSDERYLNWLFSYIHLNPVKTIESEWKTEGIKNPAKAKELMDSYRFSSYHDYFLAARPESAILSKDKFPEHFKALNDFNELIAMAKTQIPQGETL